MRIHDILESDSLVPSKINESAAEIISLGTVVRAKIKTEQEFLSLAHLFVRQTDGWQRIEQVDGLRFKLLSEKIESLDSYSNRTIIIKGPKFGEFISAPIQMFGFPNNTMFGQYVDDKLYRYLYRIGNQIEYNDKRYDIEKIGTGIKIKLIDPAFRNNDK